MRIEYVLADAIKVTQLHEVYGDEIILFDDKEESTVFHLLAEFKLGSTVYAVIQSEELRKDGEVAIYKVGKDSEGQPELETIDDDDEWENVSEIYDEMTFAGEPDEA